MLQCLLKINNLPLVLPIRELVFNNLGKTNFTVSEVLHEGLKKSSMLWANSYKIFHAGGNFPQGFVPSMNLLFETSIANIWILHVFKNVCLHAWMQHASFLCKVNKSSFIRKKQGLSGIYEAYAKIKNSYRKQIVFCKIKILKFLCVVHTFLKESFAAP